ncbi:MAG TPA: hypothetical protein ENI04_01230 [Candidatus Wildermuthbacteria bacterium]|nr:hypothetical protein [Candidatus Wildermuthbacteria bacterium]
MRRNTAAIRINNRVIGELFPEERLFKKQVQASKHLFLTLDAWGIDSDFFTDVLHENGYTIEVLETENGILYTVDAEVFGKKGQYFHFKEEKEDHRAQIFLSRRHWKKTSIVQKR